MQQVIARIPESELTALDMLAERKHISRAKAMREAVRLYLEKSSNTVNKDAFGLLKKDAIDGLKLQQTIREEWDV